MLTESVCKVFEQKDVRFQWVVIKSVHIHIRKDDRMQQLQRYYIVKYGWKNICRDPSRESIK